MMRLLFLVLSLLFFTGNSYAQNANAGQVLDQVYGAAFTGCTQTGVTTTGHNRSGPYTANRRYIVYGYNGSDISAGDALRCIWGTSSVDVNSIAGSKFGQIIYAGQQQVFLVKGSNTYLSCISKTSTMKYDVCPLE